MQQNRLLLFEKKFIVPRTPIFASVSNTINLSQIAGRLFSQSPSNNLLFTQQLLSIKLGIAANTLALTQAVAADRRNPSSNTLVPTQSVATLVDYVRSISNTLNLTQSVTGYLANRIPPPVVGVCPEEPIEAFTVEEVP